MRPTVKKVARYLYFHPTIFVNDPAYQLRTLAHAPEMSGVVWEAKRALAKGVSPIKCEHGTGKTYLLRDEEEKPLAIFKLNDHLREYAIYRLDHRRFARVPPTVLTTLTHPLFGENVTGSCQLYVDATPAVEISVTRYAALEPAPIRRIAQLDIRVINEDRHSSNMLILKEKEMIPIDHGFALPDEIGQIHFGWLNWQQTGTPFSEEEQAYIAYLDPEKDRAFLIEELGFPEKIGNRLYLATHLLKLAAIRGFYPNQIGSLLISRLEVLIERLLERDAREWTTFTKYVNEEITTLLGEYEANQQRDIKVIN